MLENEWGQAVRSRAEWVAILEKQERSGKTMAGFCREQSIGYFQFLYRRKTLRKSNPSLGMTESSQSGSRFIPIKVEEGTSFRLRFPMGLVLESDRIPPAEWIVDIATAWTIRGVTRC